MRINKVTTQIIRVGSNCHRFIMLVNGKFRSFTTDKKDILFDLAALFSMLNQRNFPSHLQSIHFWMFWVAVGVSVLLSCPIAFALPTGWEVVSGDVHFDQNGNTLNINSSSNQAIVNYQSFNLTNGETVNFNFLLPGSSILNRILGGGSSTIAGNLTGNGQVLFTNPAGIYFANTANVNVGSLIASTLSIKNSDYLAGNYLFSKDAAFNGGIVDNQGHVQAQDYVALLGSSVKNDGTITAPQVALAVGERVNVALGPDLNLQINVDQELKDKVLEYKEAIANNGNIHAQQVTMQAKVLEGKLYDSVVNNTGMISASGATQDASGRIVLYGSGNDSAALVQNTGILDANGSVANNNGGNIHLEGDSTVNSGQILAAGATGGQGGTVSMLGDTVMNLSGSKIDVSGDQGGGTALIGGDYQGKNPGVRNAKFNYVDTNAKIIANAQTQGQGGKVIVWSDDKTIFQGQIEAKGGAQGGNGGFVETSGHNILRATGSVDASAPNGKGGQWLLDPNNITIQNGGGDTNVSCSGGAPNTCSTTDDTAIVTSATINASLNAGTDVTIQTSTGGANTQAGDITIAAGTTINKTGGTDATLTLKAHNSILSNGTSGSRVSIGSSGAGNKLNVVLNADTDQGADAGTGGAIKLDYTDITSNGGNITLGGGANPLTTAALGTTANNDGIILTGTNLTAGVGNISLRGIGRSIGGTSNLYGIGLDTGSQISTTSGNITLNGTGGAGLTYGDGIRLDGNTTKLTTQDGTISVTGQGGNVSSFGSQGVHLINGASITSTGSGLLNITGTAGTGTTDNYGIILNSTATGISSLNGDITLNGTGGNGTGANNFGIVLTNTSQISSTGTAKINITGNAGAGTSTNHGVFLTATSTITSANGDITLSGIGKGTGTDNYGVYLLNGGKISSTGSALLNITGQGSTTGTTLNHGIFLSDANSRITSATGNVTVSGTGGGNGTSTDNYGLYLYNGGQITSTGAATLGLTGIGGLGTNSNIGVNIHGNGATNTYITSATGNITVNGTGRGTGTDNYGIYLQNAGRVISTGSALLNITGQASTTGTLQNHGIIGRGGNTLITSLNGDITLNGTGGGNGTGTGNSGFSSTTNAQVTSTGTAKINITGIGGNGTNNNHGVWLRSSGKVTSATGDITVNGTGNGTGLGNFGVYFDSLGEITSTGTAKINITGIGGNGTNTNYGVYLLGNSLVSSLNGDITLAGTGRGSTTDNYGLYVTSGCSIRSTGNALLNLTGQGSTTGTARNYGTFLTGANSLITSATGNVTLNATGGGNGTSTDNYGLYLFGGGKITSTGAATLGITGVGGSGTTLNHGISINANGTSGSSLITSATGDVTVTGTAHGTTTDNYGVYLYNQGQITSTGSAKLNITGTGSTTGTTLNHGINIGTLNGITGVNGDVTVTGTGNGSGASNYGITGGGIYSTGLAKLNISGTGGNGTNNNYGIYWNGGGGSSNYITSATGDITVTGQGRGSGTGNYGVYLFNGGYISSTGTAKVNVTGTGSLTGTSNNWGVNVGSGASKITSVDGDITITGNGKGSGTDNYGVQLGGGVNSIISTGLGKVNVTGTGSTSGTARNYGLYIPGSGLITSATGNVTVSGTGGGNGTSTDNYGLYLYNGGQISSTGAATLNLTGVGGSGTTLNHGIYLNGNAGTTTLITSLNGNVTLNATGNGSGASNYGLYLYNGGRITSTGAATLSLTGTGGNGTASNHGVFLDGNNATNTFITSASGNVTVTGQGGNGSGNLNDGIFLSNGGRITSTGSALLNLTGTGGTGTQYNYGMWVGGTNSLITSLNGDVTVNATGGGNGAALNSIGLTLATGGQITSTGAAKLNITGTGGTGTGGGHYGIFLNGSGGTSTSITSASGDVTLAGTGGTTGANNIGIYLVNGSRITSTGSALLNITGTGGNTTNTNYGVHLDGNGATDTFITSATGNITLNATGRGSGTDNYGLYLLNGGRITNTGTALLDITGTGGNGTNSNHGLYLYGTNSHITSLNGDVTVTGIGQGSGSTNIGVNLNNGGQITSTGNALLDITGTGSTTGTIYNFGVLLSGNGGTSTTITSASGDVTVSGTGGGNGTSTDNYGLYLYNGGRITSTGSATLDLTGLAGNGTNSNYGVFLDGNSATNTFITSATGDITLSGTGRGTGASNHGIYLLNGGQITSTGSALLNLTATGSTTGTTLNHGAFLSGTSSLISSLNGDVTLSATGNGSGASNYGLHLYNGGQITSTGNALLDITGLGGNGTTTNHGVFLDGNNATNTFITSATGDVTINATGGNGSGNNNHGLYLYNGGQITSTGAAHLALTGIKGANTSYGITSDTGSNILGSNTMTGDLTLISDHASFANLQMRTAGELTIKPYTNSTSIGINGGTGNLKMDTSLMDTSVVNPSKLTIGNSSAGTGTVTIGNNWDFSTQSLPTVEVYGGSISTGSITAGTNSLLLRARTGTITINSGSILSSNANNDALVLAAEGNFFNNAGATALSTPSGRWLVYAQNPVNSIEGGLTASKLYNQSYTLNPPASILGAGNYFLYQNMAPVISVSSPTPTSFYIPSLLTPIVYSSPLSGTFRGSVLEQAPLLSPSYLFPQAKQESSEPASLSFLLKSNSSTSMLTNPPIQPSGPNVQLQEPQTEFTPESKTTHWILKLDTAHNAVNLRDPVTGQSIAQIPVGNKPVAIVQKTDSGHAFVVNEADKTISIIDVSNHAVIQTISVDIQPIALKLSSDGQYLQVFGPNNQGPVLINLSRLQVMQKNETSIQKIINQAHKRQNIQLKKSINKLIDAYFQDT